MNLSKEELISKGFECRKGHTTSSSNHREWQTSEGETWTCLIVHKSHPEINHIEEWSTCVNLKLEHNGFETDQETWLGQGETEEEAWEEALSNGEEIEDILKKTEELIFSLTNL